MADKNNTPSRNNDNAVAALCFLALGLLLIVTAIFSSTHPLDFMVQFLGKLTLFIFIIAGISLLVGIFLYYWKIASVDPDKTLAESTKDNIEYSKHVTADLSGKAKAFYADYKKRADAAKNDKS